MSKFPTGEKCLFCEKKLKGENIGWKKYCNDKCRVAYYKLKGMCGYKKTSK